MQSEVSFLLIVLTSPRDLLLFSQFKKFFYIIRDYTYENCCRTVLCTLFLTILMYLFVRLGDCVNLWSRGEKVINCFVHLLVIPIKTELVVMVSWTRLTVKIFWGTFLLSYVWEEFKCTLYAGLSGTRPSTLRGIVWLFLSLVCLIIESGVVLICLSVIISIWPFRVL